MGNYKLYIKNEILHLEHPNLSLSIKTKLIVGISFDKIKSWLTIYILNEDLDVVKKSVQLYDFHYWYGCPDMQMPYEKKQEVIKNIQQIRKELLGWED